jgi:2-dehydropantoate 2-reductase
MMSKVTTLSKNDAPHIVVLGAGSIGSYLGGWLISAGAKVSLLGRQKALDAVQSHGFTLTDLHQRKLMLQPHQIHFHTDPKVLQLADLVLVTVKSKDTLTAAELIFAHAKPSATVISFQNGVGNAQKLASLLPHLDVIAGMVPFNVVTLPQGHLHCGTEGHLWAERHTAWAPFSPIFEQAGMPVTQSASFEEVQWGKLILNLNNAVNALSDLPLKQELSERAYRQCLACLIDETLQVLKLAGIKPAKVSRISPSLMPSVLRLPNVIFKRLAASMLRMDEQARSSMWEDLQQQRITEVGELNGAVVDLAKSCGGKAPRNERIVSLVRQAEQGRLQRLSGEALLAQLL